MIAQLQIDPTQLIEPWTARWFPQTLGSMLVGITCGVLGCFVVLRRMALIGDALSHAILPGVVVALLSLGWFGVQLDGLPPWFLAMWLLVGALGAGLLTAVLISLVQRKSRAKEDSAIGIAFTAMFAVGLVLISSLPRGTHFDLECFIYGDPLAVQTPDLILMGVVCPAVLLTVALMYHRFKLISFDPVVAAAMGVSVAFAHYLLMGMLASTIVAGIKSTGVILVVAMVITPAAAAYQLTNRLWVMLVLAGTVGALSAGIGMSLAFMVNTPTGPAMVLVAALLFTLAVLFSPNHGWVFDRMRRLRLARHVAAEDVLKALYRLGPQPETGYVEPIGTETGLPPRKLVKTVARLCAEAVLTIEQGRLMLTKVGKRHARELVRAHRLWETYLVNEAGFTAEEVHATAEDLEHAHEFNDALFEALGRPDQDPHGSEIPRREPG